MYKNYWVKLFCVLFLSLFLFVATPAFAQLVSLGNFNPFPLEDFSKMRLSDEANKQVKILLGATEGDRLEACQSLLAMNLSYGLNKWAYLEQVTQFAIDSREDIAVEIAETWLGTYPDDPVNAALRSVLIQFCAWRRSAFWEPTLEDLIRVGLPLFNAANYPQDGIDIADAHIVYARGLRRFSRNGNDPGLMREARAHLLEAEAILEHIKSDKVDPGAAMGHRAAADYLDYQKGQVAAALDHLDALSEAARARLEDGTQLDAIADTLWNTLRN